MYVGKVILISKAQTAPPLKTETVRCLAPYS